MSYTTMVVLAKSQKISGYCVAGRELSLEGSEHCLGAWKRLVSSDINSNCAIFDKHFQGTGQDGRP